MSLDPQSPADITETISARKQLACQVISIAFEDLKLWAAPSSSYKAWMRQDVQLENFEDTALFELYFFFLGWQGEPSALAALIQEFELDLEIGKIAIPVKPLIKEALLQFNACRESLGHIPLQI